MTESLNSSCAIARVGRVGGKKRRESARKEGVTEIVADQSWFFLLAKFGDMLLYAPEKFLPIYFVARSFSYKIRSYPRLLECALP